MDPQQELFTALLLALRKQGYDVYDEALPPEDTPYPFLYLGDSRQTDEPNKSLLFGVVYQTIHVWHDNPKQRGTVSAMLSAVKTTCRTLGTTAHFAWFVRDVDQRIQPDNTTKTPLLHGVLDVAIQFSTR